MTTKDKLESVRNALLSATSALNAAVANIADVTRDLPSPQPKHMVKWVNVFRNDSRIADRYYGAGNLYDSQAQATRNISGYERSLLVATLPIEFDDPGVS